VFGRKERQMGQERTVYDSCRTWVVLRREKKIASCRWKVYLRFPEGESRIRWLETTNWPRKGKKK